ncbi:MAG TPA: Holliday junction branch migration protein RuvA, partial [Gemmatimonadales bacterium]|nr:Holliday junction branch migration protein RuvA [Gemmatimonadales bacterium]
GTGPRHYLAERGVNWTASSGTDNPEAAGQMGWVIGYAPPGWTALTGDLRSRGYTDAELLAAGVAITTRRGTLIDRSPDGVVIEVSGVGYLVTVPLGVFERLPATGSEVRLHTDLVVREDAWSLYGFDSSTERDIFRRLQSASGVGARLALAILSTLGPDRAVAAVAARDLAVLSSVPGIGRKKAERIAIELADRLEDIAVSSGSAPAGSPASGAVRALAGLGFTAAAAEAAVRDAAANGATTTEELLRSALTELTRK